LFFLAAQTPLDTTVWLRPSDSRTHQATVASATSQDQVIIVADFVCICVRGGGSWLAVSSVGESLPCIENPVRITLGSGALLQDIC
jgi:hypothetical protein